MTESPTSGRLYFAYARHALVVALRAARVSQGDTVLLPELICRDILASLTAVGARPEFYPIDRDLQIASGARLPKARVVLAVNYFGFPADLRRISEASSDDQTVIIEDNAHGWLSADKDGQVLGSRTLLGITSFRKTIRSPDGAFLAWKEGADIDVGSLPAPLSPRLDELPLPYRTRRMVSHVDAVLPIRLMATTRFAIRKARVWAGKDPVFEDPNDEINLPEVVAPHEVSLGMYKGLDVHSEVRRRQSLYQACQQLAQRHSVTGPRLACESSTSPQGFPFYANEGEVVKFTKQVVRKKLGEVVRWPTLPCSSPLAVDSQLRTLHLVNFLQ